MGIFSAEEFHEELKKRGLEPTEIRTRTARLWKEGKGWHISVPDHGDSYPESVLDRLLEQVGKLYHSPDEFN